MPRREEDSDNSKEESSDDRDDQRNEDPPTSTQGGVHPERDSHNMNDLTPLDFNSADEIRQAMKAIISGNTPNNDEGNCKNRKRDDRSKLPSSYNTNKTQRELNINKNSNKNDNTTDDPQSNRKRRGRPTRAGPSKKIQKVENDVTNMYFGKLSNVAGFRSRRGKYDSDSDTACKKLKKKTADRYEKVSKY